jgi:RNA polymerase sigma-70 factor, ECF subfamily
MAPSEPTPPALGREAGEFRTKGQETPVPALAYSATRHRAAWAEADDRALLAGLRRGDEDALDELIGRKTKPLVQLAARILGDQEEARDVVQMAFLRLWDHRDRYDEKFSPNTWIYRIATNLAIDHLRSRQSRERSHEPVRHHMLRVQDDSTRRNLAALEGREVKGIFEKLAQGLTEKQRLVFLLREVEGLSSQEVAAIAGCRESTVRNHLFNARRFLRQELVQRFPEYAAGRVRLAAEGGE